MTTTWPLELPGIKPITDKVTQELTVKTATVPKEGTVKAANTANTMLAAEAAVALSIITGTRVTTEEALLRRSLPLEKLFPRRNKI